MSLGEDDVMAKKIEKENSKAYGEMRKRGEKRRKE